MQGKRSVHDISKLYRKYHQDVYRFIYLLSGNHQQAEDLMHDTFLRAFSNYHKLQHAAKEKTWLFSIAKHVTVDFLRRKSLIHWVSEKLLMNHSSNEPTPDKVVQLGEHKQELYMALEL